MRIADLTRIQEAAAEHTPGVVFVPTRALFAGQDGQYADALPDDDGTVRVLRGGDGIHLSHDGAARLAAHVLTHVHLPTDPAASTRGSGTAPTGADVSGMLCHCDPFAGWR